MSDIMGLTTTLIESFRPKWPSFSPGVKTKLYGRFTALDDPPSIYVDDSPPTPIGESSNFMDDSPPRTMNCHYFFGQFL